jgi:hypothetical protein
MPQPPHCWAACYLWEPLIAHSRLLCLAYCVAQVRNADPRDHRRVAKDQWCAGEVVKESNS